MTSGRKPIEVIRVNLMTSGTYHLLSSERERTASSINRVPLHNAPPERNALFPTPAVADRSSGRLVFAFALVAYMTVDVWLLRWIPVASDTGDYWHVFYTSYT